MGWSARQVCDPRGAFIGIRAGWALLRRVEPERLAGRSQMLLTEREKVNRPPDRTRPTPTAADFWHG